MPLDKVVYSRTFHLGDHNFEKIGTEGTIIEGETKESLRDEAVKFVYDSFAELHPELNVTLPPLKKEDNYFNLPTEERPGTHLDTSSPEFIKMQIETCKSLAVLKAVYPKLIKGNVELETIYNQKLEELSK